MNPEVLASFRGVGKDYPRIDTTGGRLRTLAALVSGRGSFPHFRALDGIDLDVRRGESLGLVGVNGAGKSTLLKILAGVVRPSRGTVETRGRVTALLELGSGFHPEYTGRENIDLAAALQGLSRAETRDRVEEIITFADIGEHIDQPLKHYSSGMVVRLGFAVASRFTPDLLVTDEVLAVGDESFQKKCIRWLQDYLSGGGTLLLVSHSMYHVQTLCRRAVWLHEGRLRLEGSAFDVTREYLTWHEERSRSDVRAEVRPATGPCVLDFWIENADGETTEAVRQGEELVLEGVVRGDGAQAPVILFGLVRADGTPVYGSHSNDAAYRPALLGGDRHAFRVRFPSLGLLPGKYTARAHALDPEGLRLFDTAERAFVVKGETRDYGLVRVEHAWEAGRGHRLP